jgi:hypothetical protein
MSAIDVQYTIDLARKGYEPVNPHSVCVMLESGATLRWLAVRSLGSDAAHPGCGWDKRQYYLDNDEYHGYNYADADGNVFYLKPATGYDVVRVA